VSSLIFLKRQTKKADEKFFVFFLLFSLKSECFFPSSTERVKINHRKKNRDSKKKKKKKKKKKTKTKTIK